MIRRRSTPWIHKWSRPLIGAIAGLGILNTGYLTFEKLTGGNPVCTTPENVKGCTDVLSSAWGTVFGQPLALFGLLAYISMFVLALFPLALNSVEGNKSRKQIENLTWWLLLVGAIAMSVFSGYLMYVLAFELKAVCYYCIASALFALSMLTLTILGRDWEDIGQIFFTALIVGMVTLIATLGIYSGVNTSGNIAEPTDGKAVQIFFDPKKEEPTPDVGWKITTTSGESEIELAKHLTKIGAKEYVAWWCPHCHEQKLLFGQEAYKEINHVECASPGNPNLQTQDCIAAKIESYPTWIINGKTYSGVQNLNELSNISDYTGSRNFKYFK
ncbi:vitamin K epoxide reductase family protein [Sphaerospermopsis aphanizomenoides BCCUSP55]|uniref:vitamin K epoxide reductase family protein n=1 Tax=Sphaerospermopsis aphanizomenoides TaxID=459663 RepID=UPI000B03192E|nr:vitamin K epoxide reductase family protein [Sphaerospermopsis aphanizomenoides]MBK1988780.1 vitamin K epoxide reductase family protein [Sphaerospermopsis aphanizomenoides BCCUSP55]